jgi:hypothetical protein
VDHGCLTQIGRGFHALLAAFLKVKLELIPIADCWVTFGAAFKYLSVIYNQRMVTVGGITSRAVGAIRVNFGREAVLDVDHL